MNYTKKIVLLCNNQKNKKMNSHLHLKQNLFLNRQIVGDTNEKKVELNTNHIFVIDCSGSMWDELAKIRRDMYNKISTIMKPNDTISLIWFSGKGQYGIILEDFSLKDDSSLRKIKELIERHLTPRGLTAFKQPIEEVGELVKRTIAIDNNKANTLFFLTDGYDNQSSTSEIIEAIGNIKELINAATIVEYGWYCNKELLSKMATEIGGVHIFSENFQEYEPYLEKEFLNGVAAKRNYIKIEGEVTYGFVYEIKDSEIINYKVNDDNEVLAENGIILYYISEKPSGVDIFSFNTAEELNTKVIIDVKGDLLKPLYASMYSFSKLNNFNMVSEILSFIGDVELIKLNANTFGSQKINELENKFIDLMKNPEKRFAKGYDPKLEPAEDAYCVLNLIDDLMSSDENKWYPKHEAFNYKRIGRKAIELKGATESDKEEMKELVESNNMDELKNKLEEISKKENKLKFIYENEEAGHPIKNLVWNEKRANLSVNVRYDGEINLENEIDRPEKVDKIFKTNIFRNYTIIKDGIVHSYTLPVSLSEETFNKLQQNDLLVNETYSSNTIYILDFSSLPVINRKMVKEMSAKDLFLKEYELLTLKAKNTVFNHYRKEMLKGVKVDFIDLYGTDGAEWLKEKGIAPYGFSPKTTLEKTQEEIMVNSLQVKINKLTLMTAKKDFDKVLKKIKEGTELTQRESLLVPAIKEFETFMKTMEGVDDNSLIEKWLDKKSEFFKNRKNELMNQVSREKFLCTVSKSWFKEFDSREDGKMEIEIDGNTISFEVIEKQQKIKL